MLKQKRDANEKAIILYLRFIGCYVQQMDKGAGFDLLVVREQVWIAEVKNPALCWRMTPEEKRVRASVEGAGGKYHVLLGVDDAREMVLGA